MSSGWVFPLFLSGACSSRFSCSSPLPLTLLAPSSPAHSQSGLPNHPCPSKQLHSCWSQQGQEGLWQRAIIPKSARFSDILLQSRGLLEGQEQETNRNRSLYYMPAVCWELCLLDFTPSHDSSEVRHYYPHFSEEETENPRSHRACPESYSWKWGAHILEAVLPESKAYILQPLYTPPP